MKYKNAMGAVVATALLIVVTVLAVVGFQTWYQGFESNILSKTEQTSLSDSLEIKGVIDNQVYFHSDGSKLNSIEIFDSDGSKVCTFSDSFNSSSNENVDLTSGLVGFWKLNDESATITDYSGQGNDGKLYGNTRMLLNFDDGTATDQTAYENNGNLMNGVNCSVEGINGQGCSFDGVDDYISLGNETNLNFNNKITISVWARINEAGMDIGLNQYLVMNGNGSFLDVINNNFALYLANGDVGISNDYISFIIFNGTNLIYTVNSEKVRFDFLNSSLWYHIVGVADGNYLKIYLNGKEITESRQLYNGTINSNSKEISIGRLNDDSRYFNGSIDEVAIYSKALTEEEVKDLYNSQKAKFIEFKDSKLDKSIEFDGVDDYIEIPDDDSLDLNSNSGHSIFVNYKISQDNLNKNSIIVSKMAQDGIYRGYQIAFRNSKLYYYDISDYSSIYKDFSEVQSNNPIKVSNYCGIIVNGTSAEDFQFYCNGNLESKTILNDNLSGPISNNYNLTFGRRTYLNDLFYNGEIDEVRIYNRPLNGNEISQLYFNSISNTEVGLNTLDLSSCNLNKGEKYEIFATTNTSTVDAYFVAK